MTNKVFCTECLEEVDAVEICKNELFNIKGEDIVIKSKYYECQACKGILYDPEDPSKNIEKAYSEYRARKNILSPEELKSVRERYGLSQRQLAKILGWGHSTVSKYESGALPSKNHNNTLVLLRDPSNLYELLERNKGDLTNSEFNNIKRKLSEYIKENKNKMMFSFMENVFSTNQDEYSGYQKFSIEKLTQMVKFFASKDSNLYKLRLLKFLFYSDFLCFKRTTLSMSGLQYVRLPRGPVPKDYDIVLDLAVRTGEINKELVYFGYPNPGEKFESVGDIDFSIFTRDEIEVMELVYSKLKHHNSDSISEFSHQESAWANTNPSDAISYKYANELSID